jgi:orotidine-5'-phosphate decarboxylase
MVINSSRGILYAGDPGEAALRLRDEINRARARSGR